MEYLLEDQETAGVMRVESVSPDLLDTNDQTIPSAYLDSYMANNAERAQTDNITRIAVQCQQDITGQPPDKLSNNTTFNEIFRYIQDKADRHPRLKDTSYDTKQEIIQTAACKVLLAFKNNQFEAKSKFSTWLHAVISNTASTHLKQENDKPHSGIDMQILPDKTNLEEAITDKLSIDEEIAGLIATPSLTSREKTVIGYLIKGYKYYEIALALGVSYGAVRVIMTRIRNKAKNNRL